MKKLIFLSALLILGCTKIEQNYSIEVRHPNNTTEVTITPFQPVMVEITAGNNKDTLFLNKLPQKAVFAGNLSVASRELNCEIW